jgi:hypothetical protein
MLSSYSVPQYGHCFIKGGLTGGYSLLTADNMTRLPGNGKQGTPLGFPILGISEHGRIGIVNCSNFKFETGEISAD